MSHPVAHLNGFTRAPYRFPELTWNKHFLDFWAALEGFSLPPLSLLKQINKQKIRSLKAEKGLERGNEVSRMLEPRLPLAQSRFEGNLELLRFHHSSWSKINLPELLRGQIWIAVIAGACREARRNYLSDIFSTPTKNFLWLKMSLGPVFIYMELIWGSAGASDRGDFLERLPSSCLPSMCAFLMLRK